MNNFVKGFRCGEDSPLCSYELTFGVMGFVIYLLFIYYFINIYLNLFTHTYHP